MKLLIGGKNRNIHFRKDKSAFYKSNGEEHDVSKLFKKVGGGLKKQYEEYLVSDNDLTEKYKALSISGGSSSNASKKKPVHNKHINKKKRKGKKFVGGMSINSLNIDIDADGPANGPAVAANMNERFRVYLKLIGAYYLALLSEADSFIFGNNTAAKAQEFHRNKLNNLIIINFMEPGNDAINYLPFDDRNLNLIFCQMLLKKTKLKDATGTDVAFDFGAIDTIFNEIITDIDMIRGAAAAAAAAPTGVKYIAFKSNPGPNIIEDMLEYKLPDYAVPNNAIKAQFYRCIIADLTVSGAGAGGPHPFIQSELDPLPILDLENGALIEQFEERYAIAGGFVNLSILNSAAVNADAIAHHIGRVAVAAVAAVPANDNTYTDELRKIPYQLLQNLISNEIHQDATNNPIAGAPGAPAAFTASLAAPINAVDLKNAYYNSIVETANTAVTTAAARLPGPPPRGTGLFALNIP